MRLPIRQISIDPFFSLQVFALFELVQVGSMTRFEKKNKRTNNDNNKIEVNAKSLSEYSHQRNNFCDIC